MKTSIFVRILAAILLPLVVISSLVFVAINNVFYENASALTRDFTAQIAKEAAGRITHTLENMSTALHFAGIGLSGMDFNSPDAVRNAEGVLKTLQDSSPLFRRARLAFKDGVVSKKRYYKTLARDSAEAEANRYGNSDEPEDPELSLCLDHPHGDRRFFVNVMASPGWNADGSAPMLAGAMTHTITSGGAVIGCVGLDILYNDMLRPIAEQFGSGKKLLLLSRNGRILYSSNDSEVNQTLREYKSPNSRAFSPPLTGNGTILEEGLSPFLGKDSLIGLYPIPIESANQTLYLYLDIPIDNLNASVKSSIRVVALIGALGLLLLVVCVFFASRHIARPIRRLTGNFDRAANGDFGPVLGTDASGNPKLTGMVELDSMQASLGKMLDQISRTHALELKATQAEAETEKILASSQARTRFFAAISHEIRTPMNAILGISEILLHDGKLTPMQKKNVNDIKLSCDSLLGIINDILDLSRLESGNMRLVPVDFDLPAMMDNIASMTASLAEAKGLAFHYETEGDIPHCLRGDDIRLRQILLNLLSNAIKFTSKGFVIMQLFGEEESLRFTVGDTGVGVHEADLPLLFQPYKRVESQENRSVQGTGLGLSICRSLVDLMGGSIGVESRHGVGSVFTVAIPKIPGDASALLPKPAGGTGRHFESARVLVVDDNEINLNIASGLLKALHHVTPDLALSGRDALEKVARAEYDLIFMDHRMPDMDGAETTERIRAMGDWRASVPIVALTANAGAGVWETLQASGMNEMLSKPIRKAELEKTLVRWLRGKTAVYSSEGALGETQAVESSLMLAKLAGTELLDVAAGLESVAGQRDVYERSLWLLHNKIARIVRALGDLLSQGDTRTFSIHAHGMKSSLASIGALSLSRMAERLEKAGSAGNIQYCKDALPSFVRQLQELDLKLADLLSERRFTAEAGREEDDGLNIADKAAKLHSALVRHDYETIDNAMRAILSRSRGPKLDAAFAKIRYHVDLFEYDAARKLVEDAFPEMFPAAAR